jgi:hypothetical protein
MHSRLAANSVCGLDLDHFVTLLTCLTAEVAYPALDLTMQVTSTAARNHAWRDETSCTGIA